VTFYWAYREADGTLVRDHGCEGYYNAHFTLGWDLDNNGSFETTGDSATFSAATLDGPTTATVFARAQHPTDTSPIGTGDPIAVPIEVRNVPPAVSATVTDALGNSLDGGSPPAILGLPVNVSASFTDPGILDTHTATIDWGDGSPLDTSFATFADSLNGATGALKDTHVFTSPGTKQITVTVTDKDGGVTTKQLTVSVLSSKAAILGTANQLTQLIAATTNSGIASALRNARDQLIGNHAGTPPTNGATDKLDANDPSTAITKLKVALAYLATAESLGAGNLTPLKDLLGLAAEGIATATYQHALAAFPNPSSGQAKTLAAIGALIATGNQQLASHQYANACDSYKAATDKAIAMR
jgi:hypothetical protein